MSTPTLNEMKVADLKKELQKRKLSTAGTKAQLIDRLETALDEEMLIDTDETKESDQTEPAQAPAKVDTKSKPTAKKTANSKSVVLENKTEENKTSEAVVKVKTTEAKPVPVIPEIKTATTAEEKAALRAQRFGIVDPEAKKRERAKRFGIESENDPDKIEQRAKRFGLTTDSQKQEKVSDWKVLH